VHGSLKQLFDLSSRVALITGGSRGLGLQIAEALGEFGAAVVLVARKEDELAAAAAALAQKGVKAFTIAVDLGGEADFTALVERALSLAGRIDILVNNAGATWGAPAEDYPIQAWEKVMGLNVTSLFRLTQAVAKAAFLPQHKGAVINVASIEGLKGHSPHHAPTVAYNTSKGAVINLTRALAAEWGPRGVRVNALAPGFFPTKMTYVALDAMGEEIIKATPLGRLGGDDDLKGAALLLASDAGAHITGQTIVVDGGVTIV
jgi:NAD(P)-dependent dehydrogenase (short-subunit alcohol dehydrogenase family)